MAVTILCYYRICFAENDIANFGVFHKDVRIDGVWLIVGKFAANAYYDKTV